MCLYFLSLKKWWIALSLKNCPVHGNNQGIQSLVLVLFHANFYANIKLRGIVVDRNQTCSNIRRVVPLDRNKCYDENPINDWNISILHYPHCAVMLFNQTWCLLFLKNLPDTPCYRKVRIWKAVNDHRWRESKRKL